MRGYMHTEMFLLILRRGYVLFFKSPTKCQSLHQSAVWISLILEHGTRPHQSNHWNDQQPSDCTTHHLKEVSQRTCRVLFLERNVTRFNDGKAAFFCTRQPDVLATLDTPCPPPKKPTLAHYSSKLHGRISVIFGTKRGRILPSKFVHATCLIFSRHGIVCSVPGSGFRFTVSNVYVYGTFLCRLSPF